MTEQLEETKETIRQHLTFIKDNLKGMPWFEQQLKRDWNAEALRIRAEQQAHRIPNYRQDEIDTLEARIRSDVIGQLSADIGSIRDLLSHDRYNDYQLRQMLSYFTSGVTPVSKWAQRLMTPSPGGMLDEQAARVVWAAIYLCVNVPKAGPPPIHPNFAKPNQHPDKTDQLGLRFYWPTDADGFALKDFDPETELSQTEAARNCRKAYGAYGRHSSPIPRMKTQKELDAITEKRLAEKNAQREAAHRHREQLDMADKHQFDEAIKQRNKQREEYNKTVSHFTRKVSFKQGEPSTPSDQSTFIYHEKDKEQKQE